MWPNSVNGLNRRFSECIYGHPFSLVPLLSLNIHWWVYNSAYRDKSSGKSNPSVNVWLRAHDVVLQLAIISVCHCLGVQGALLEGV